MTLAFHDIRFPLRLSLATSGGPVRRTDIVNLSNGRESRNSRWRDARRSYDAGSGSDLSPISMRYWRSSRPVAASFAASGFAIPSTSHRHRPAHRSRPSTSRSARVTARRPVSRLRRPMPIWPGSPCAGSQSRWPAPCWWPSEASPFRQATSPAIRRQALSSLQATPFRRQVF